MPERTSCTPARSGSRSTSASLDEIGPSAGAELPGVVEHAIPLRPASDPRRRPSMSSRNGSRTAPGPVRVHRRRRRNDRRRMRLRRCSACSATGTAGGVVTHRGCGVRHPRRRRAMPRRRARRALERAGVCFALGARVVEVRADARGARVGRLAAERPDDLGDRRCTTVAHRGERTSARRARPASRRSSTCAPAMARRSGPRATARPRRGRRAPSGAQGELLEREITATSRRSAARVARRRALLERRACWTRATGGPFCAGARSRCDRGSPGGSSAGSIAASCAR